MHSQKLPLDDRMNCCNVYHQQLNIKYTPHRTDIGTSSLDAPEGNVDSNRVTTAKQSNTFIN